MGKLYSGDVELGNIVDFSDFVIFDGGEIPKYVTGIHCPLSADQETSFECTINAPLFAELTGANVPASSSFTATCEMPYSVQRRRHKKKRINKKWAKRYGYMTRFKKVTLEDFQIIDSNDDEFTFITKGVGYEI